MKEANAMLWVVTTKLQQNEIKLLRKQMKIAHLTPNIV